MRTRFLVATLLATALLLPGQANARTTFEQPTRISPLSPRTPYEDARMAEGPDGTVFFVWSKTIFANGENPFNEARIQIRTLGPDGTLSPVSTIGAGNAAAYYLEPQVAAYEAGGALIAWADTAGTIHAAPVSPNGQLGSARIVGEGLAQGRGPQLVIDDWGQAFVSWTGPDHLVRVAAVAPDGTPGPVRTIDGSGSTRLVGGADPRIVWVDGPHGVFSARLAPDGATFDRVRLVRGAPHTEFDPIEVAGPHVVIGERTFAKVQVGKVLLVRIDGNGPTRVLDRAPLPYPDKPGSIFSGFGIAAERGRAVVSWRERKRNRPHAPSRVHAALVDAGGSIEGVERFGARRVLMTAAAFGPNGDPVVGWAGREGIRVARIKRGGRIRKVQRVPGSETRRGARGLRMLRTRAGLRVTWEGLRTGLDRRVLTSLDG